MHAIFTNGLCASYGEENIALILDNCTCFLWKIVSLVLLPPNTIAINQVFDQGVTKHSKLIIDLKNKQKIDRESIN